MAEARISLNEQRLNAIVSALKQMEPRSVLDLGCGEGKLLSRLLQERVFGKIVGVDVSIRSLEIAKDRLRLDEMPDKLRRKIDLFQGSVVYRDARFSGFDAAVLVEVIEHVDESRLPALARTVFGEARPKAVLVTTPNSEYNVRFSLPIGAFRHKDHRFEMTQEQFRKWACDTADHYQYSIEFGAIGDVDEKVGPPTQMAIFRLKDALVQGAEVSS